LKLRWSGAAPCGRRWGPNGQLIVNLIPEVEFILGKQPPIPELPPRDAQNRFQLVFRRFFGAFARPEHSLALFLDDLQWLDAATLELLEQRITDPEVRRLLLVGAYRDNEVSSSHPLTRTLEAIRKAGANMQEIVMASLRLDDVGRLPFNKSTPERELVDVNEVIGEMIILLRSEAMRYNISVRTELAAALPQIMGIACKCNRS
jgi:hypothetical protein